MVYKIKKIRISLLLLLIAMIFSSLFCLINSDFNVLTYLFSFFIVFGLEVCVFFLKPFLVAIIIDEDSISLHYRKFLINAFVKNINLNAFSFSYKLEKGARGIEENELRFYENGKKIIGIGRGFDGWTEETISEIITDFKKMKIHKFE